MLAAPPAAAEPPDTIVLSGTVRDFRQAHVDFNVDPIDGTGHFAGNVDLTLAPGGRPVFTGNGFKVAAQWRNSGSEPIPPHLYMQGGGSGAVRVAEALGIPSAPTAGTTWGPPRTSMSARPCRTSPSRRASAPAWVISPWGTRPLPEACTATI
jgi:hypothetical protein